MPIIKSARKRVKIAAKARARNAHTKRSLRLALKEFGKAVDSGKTANIQKAQRDAVSALDIAVKKAVIHRNKAARQKSALAARAKAGGVKLKAQSSKPKAKTTAKKAPAKAAPAKKTAARKSAPRKTAK